jgi:hypothetical protein
MKKTAQRKQSPNRRKFTQSGHPGSSQSPAHSLHSSFSHSTWIYSSLFSTLYVPRSVIICSVYGAKRIIVIFFIRHLCTRQSNSVESKFVETMKSMFRTVSFYDCVFGINWLIARWRSRVGRLVKFTTAVHASAGLPDGFILKPKIPIWVNFGGP